MQFEGLIVNYNCMTCINATLVADNYIGWTTQQIGDFAFSFIAPLGTDNNYVSQESFAPELQFTQTLIICHMGQSVKLSFVKKGIGNRE